jgi:hypothetical protein
MPISYADATPFLKALGGATVPENWRGNLPFTYHVGPSKVQAHLATRVQLGSQAALRRCRPIPGAKYPDQWVIRGNHHDGWVNGAEDPSPARALNWKRRAAGDCSSRAGSPIGPSSTASGMAKSRAAGLDRVGGDARGRTEASMRSRTSIPMEIHADIFAPRDRTRSRTSSTA